MALSLSESLWVVCIIFIFIILILIKKVLNVYAEVRFSPISLEADDLRDLKHCYRMKVVLFFGKFM